MALYAALTDGIDTVYMRRCQAGDPLSGLPDGYEQKVARRNDDGSFDDVTETWELRFSSNTDADRADELIKLGNLRQKIWRRRDLRLADGWVWLEVQTPTENARRYALANDIFIPTMSVKHYHDNALPDLTVEITREGVWRPTAPNLEWGGTPDKATNTVVVTNVYNHTDDNNSNRFYIEGVNRVGGDGGALARFEFVHQGDTNRIRHNILIAAKVGNKSDLDLFNPHFNPQYATQVNGSFVADSNAPGGYRFEAVLTAGNTAQMTWIIPYGSFHVYDGSFMAFAVVEPNQDVEMRLLFNTYPMMENYVSCWVDNVPAGKYANVFLGVVKFLDVDGRKIPFIEEDQAQFSLELLAINDTTVRVRNVYFVPIEHGLFGYRDAETNVAGDSMTVHLDNELNNTVYAVFTATGKYYYFNFSLRNPSTIGQVFTIPPNQDVAFYLFGSNSDNTYFDDADYYDMNQHVDITIRYFERYQTLRD
ncbi:MAG TPA: hypothetical protein EYH05_18570 [Anaerolineae bacterium]|nr:hypothetical protein [Anaerolineae bacterium]